MKTAANCVSVCESQEYQIHRQVERTLRRRHSHVLPSLLHEGRISIQMHRHCSACVAAAIQPLPVRGTLTALGSFALLAGGLPAFAVRRSLKIAPPQAGVARSSSSPVVLRRTRGPNLTVSSKTTHTTASSHAYDSSRRYIRLYRTPVNLLAG